MAARKEFNFIRFLRLSDLLPSGNSIELSKEAYLASVPGLREQLETDFLDKTFDVEQEIRSNPDTKITYEGYVKLADEDLRWSSTLDKEVLSTPSLYDEAAKEAAKGMIKRLIVIFFLCPLGCTLKFLQAYENLIRQKFATAIRLSIHPSTGKSKISVPLLPHDTKSRGTPWHSSIAVLANGEIRPGHSKEYREKYELIQKHGKPYYFREKNQIFELEVPIEIDYEYEGLILKKTTSEPLILNKRDEEKLAELILRFRSVRALGFDVSEINFT